MNRWQLFALLGAAFLLGALAVRYAPEVSTAVAQDSDVPENAIAPENAIEPTEALTAPVMVNDDPSAEPAVTLSNQGGRLVCRLFLVDVTDSGRMDTADRTTEVGQWVGEQVDSGLVLHGVDFEVGQKPTGYPQGYLNVCVYPGA